MRRNTLSKLWLTALEKTIKKRWILLAKGESPSHNCTLCDRGVFLSRLAKINEERLKTRCEECPVALRTGFDFCQGTPYKAHLNLGISKGIEHENTIVEAKKMLSFLLELHPIWKRGKLKFYKEHGIQPIKKKKKVTHGKKKTVKV